ncbi:hypothetical protein GCM10011316_25650 [Roseibium aquae]|uniref:Uncharacterized protein n=1 Tax=Roseibium aquae TaxID=1323746 RepID=A0A916TLT7_9HYPH|nr:hypothetical protein GCM10011316_25650 [Roseibium aquae]
MKHGSVDIENCPVSEEVLRQLTAETLSQATEQARRLPSPQRSQLAVYCYRRAHLRPLGLAVAADCTREGLIKEAGYAGNIIHQQAAERLGLPGADASLPRHGKRPVSLSRV